MEQCASMELPPTCTLNGWGRITNDSHQRDCAYPKRLVKPNLTPPGPKHPQNHNVASVLDERQQKSMPEYISLPNKYWWRAKRDTPPNLNHVGYASILY